MTLPFNPSLSFSLPLFQVFDYNFPRLEIDVFFFFYFLDLGPLRVSQLRPWSWAHSQVNFQLEKTPIVTSNLISLLLPSSLLLLTAVKCFVDKPTLEFTGLSEGFAHLLLLFSMYILYIQRCLCTSGPGRWVEMANWYQISVLTLSRAFVMWMFSPCDQRGATHSR